MESSPASSTAALPPTSDPNPFLQAAEALKNLMESPEFVEVANQHLPELVAAMPSLPQDVREDILAQHYANKLTPLLVELAESDENIDEALSEMPELIEKTKALRQRSTALRQRMADEEKKQKEGVEEQQQPDH